MEIAKETAYKINAGQHARVMYLLLSLLATFQVKAFSFEIFDARTAAMGGVGFAWDFRNAAFYNPALVAMTPSEYNWIAVAPAAGKIESVDDVKSGVEDIVNGVGNRTRILEDIMGETRRVFEYANLMLVVPSEVLGGAAYLNRYRYHTSKVIVDDGIGDALEHRALRVTDIGAVVGKFVSTPFLGIGAVMIGINTKMQLFESHGYTEAIDGADFSLDDSEINRGDSTLNFDLGVTRERGVWKTSLVLKDILAGEYSYGESDDLYRVQPMARFGIAYQSRRTFFEFDVDLTENEGIGHNGNTRYVAVGGEWQVLPGFFPRAGFRQNLAGDNDSLFTLGIGFHYFSLIADFSFGFSGDVQGSFAQFGFKL